MGFIEEGRQLIQDFVTPEIRSIDARLTVVEKSLDALGAKVDRVQATLESKIEGVDSKIDRVQATLKSEIDGVRTTLESKIDGVRTTLESTIDGVRTTLESKIDRNHAQVMDALHRMENYSLVLERLARVESKLQNVA